MTGDYEKTVLALAINPLTPSDTVAKQIVDEMLEAHRHIYRNFIPLVQNIQTDFQRMDYFIQIMIYAKI